MVPVADPATSGDLAATVSGSSLSTLFWAAATTPCARGVVSLWRADKPALAFTYADADVARDIASAQRVGLAFTETRGTGATFRPLVVVGRPQLVEDPAGELFSADLLDQELRKFPPARLLADSVLLRREHWWYLPRLIVQLEVTDIHKVEPRGRDRDHLLVTVDSRGEPDGRPAGLVEEQPDVLRLDVDGTPATGTALLFGQDASFPDLERWSQWRYRGTWDGIELHVDEAPTRPGLAPPLGLLQRWRRQRSLEKACRQELADR